MSDVSLSFYCYLCRYHCHPSCYCFLICSSLFHDSSFTLTWQDETIICRPGARWAWPESECCRPGASDGESDARGSSCPALQALSAASGGARRRNARAGQPYPSLPAGTRARSLTASGRLTPDVHTYMQTNTRTPLKKRAHKPRTYVLLRHSGLRQRSHASRAPAYVTYGCISAMTRVSAASSACEKTVRQ